MSIRRRKQSPDSQRLIGRVDASAHAEATYTVSPDDVAGYDLMSQWITAPVAAVESLEAMR